MKKYSLFILLLTLLAICSVSFADTVQIGTGTGTTSYLPIYGLYGYNYTQQIYTQAQINKAGNITKLRFFYVSGTITNSKDWVIYMGHTTKTTFSSTTDWEPLANLTQVFAGDVSSYVPLANNWMEIPLTTPFNYNNTNNLIIAVDENTPNYASMTWGAFTSGSNTGIYYYSDTVNPDPATPPTASSRTGSIDRIQLVFPNTSAPLAPTLLFPPNGGWTFTDGVLSWTPTLGAGDANAYDVYFGTSANPPLVSSNQTATTYTPTLAAGTTYYWKVVAKNEIGDSPATDIWSFKTPTATQLAESFENISFPPVGWANPGSWSRNTGYNKHGTASAYKYGSTSTQYILSTPKVTITGTSTLDLWTLCSTTSGTLQIVYSPDRTIWTQIGSNITHPAAYTWYNTVVDLSSLAGNNYYLGIRTGLQSASFYVDLAIGPEFTSEAPGAPSLSVPADLATNVNELTTFTWTAPTTGGVPTGYKLYCDTNNPPVTMLAAVTSLTITLTTPLDYSTTYYWTVSAYNPTGEGPKATVRSFTTRDDPIISTFPWVEDFGTTTNFPPLNWSRLTGLYPSETPAITTSGWAYDDFANVVTTPQNMSARLNIWSTTTKYWLVTPPIAIPGTGYELKFDLALTTYSGIATPPTPGGQPDDRFIVLISDSPLMTNPTVLREWNNTGSAYVYDNISPSGENHIISLNTYSGIKYLAFYGESTVSGGDNNVYVDNVTVRETPAAPIFSYTPTSINFGMLQQNLPATPVNVTVTNTGGGTLNLNSSDISITGPNAAMFSFNPVNLPAALGVGQSVSIPVSVTVTQEGLVSATLRITYNATNYDVALSAEGLPLGFIVVGNGISDHSLPIEPYYGYTYSQSIFLQSELNIAGQQINKVYYHWNGAAEATLSNGWTIYMGHTTNTSFADGTSWIPLSNLTQVFAGEVALPATAGWIEIMLTSPFVYNNTDNLVIAVDENEGSYDGSSEYFYCTSAATARSIRYYSDGTNPDPSAPPTGTTVLGYPNVMLQFGELPSGPPDPVTLTYPANGATGLPDIGFNLTWTRALTGGIPSYYVVYMSQDEETIYDDYYWEITNTSFNPVTEGGITFNYLDRWYWTVEAINDDGSAVVEPPYSFGIMADPRVNIPYAQDFGTDGTWPLNWTQTYSGGISSNRWTLSNTNSAGGTAYEMKATWVNAIGLSRLITPPLNTDGIANFSVNFNTYYNDYATGITAKVQYSFDLNTWYDTPWSIISGSGDVTGNQTALITGLSNHPTTYVAWVLDGNHYQFDYWYIDDVNISLPAEHDVMVVSYDVENQVVPENTVVTPMATVGNNGINIETFNVTCTIGTYSSTQTVSGLALGATQQVTFAPLTPALWTAELVEITTNLVGDEVPANDTFYSALICLPLNTTGLANNAQTDQFVQFNLANPGVLNALPNGYTGTSFVAGADWKNGQWLGVEYDDGTLATDNYLTIDPLTGVYTDVGDLGAAIMGNAWDDTHDIMYGVANTGYLYVMNPFTGAVGVGDSLWYNLEGTNYSLANIGGLMIDIAYDNTNNILYGIDLGNDCLWTINPATYELTLVGFLGIDLNYAQDAAFDQDNGLLYLAGYAGGGALYWLDTTYGGAYKVGNFTASAYELTAFAIPYGTLASAPVATISGTGQLSWTPVSGAVAYNVYSADDPYGTFTLEATVRGTTYTGPSAPKKFYKVTAVGGRQQTNHQEIRFREPIKYKGKLNQNDRYDFGPVNGFSMRSK